MAGLALARDLSRRHRVILFESTAHTGGRVRTEYDEGGVSYEAGAWRVDAGHVRVRREFRRYDVPLESAPRASIASTATPSSPSPATATVAASQWDAWAMEGGFDFRAADERDLGTGYAGISESAYGSEPYKADGPFYVAPLGFSEWIRRLERDVLERGVDVRRSTRVEDVVVRGSRYEIVCKRRRDNVFLKETHLVHHVILCTPPSVWQDWPILKRYARSLSSAVEAEVLHHIYVQSAAPPTLSRVHSGQNVVASLYDGSPWWQVSYSSGRVARYWHNLALRGGSVFLNHLQAFLTTMSGGDERVERVKRHYWAFAFHKWRAVPNFRLKHAVRASIRVNPHTLPNVYCAGEALSSHQGWMEGALETAEMVRDALQGPPPDLPRANATSVLVEGRPVDVASFVEVHPGSAKALTSRFGQEVDEFMLQYHHSPHAWAIVHSRKLL